MTTDRAKIARLNKSRSKTMERELADYFHGQRVPMSGSGSMKGDIMFPLDEYRSIYGECKLTEKDTLKIPLAWLGKIQTEAKTMRCVFGVLLYRLMKPRIDFVCLESSVAERLHIEIMPMVEYTHQITVNRTLPSYSVSCLYGNWSFTTKERFYMALQCGLFFS